MTFIDAARKEINYKVVFAGAAGSGKKTTVTAIQARFAPAIRDPLLTLASPSGPTCFFSVKHPTVQINGHGLRIHFYSAPGPEFVDDSSKSVLRGVGAIVFVVDSDVGRLAANQQALQSLEAALAAQRIDLAATPLVLQYNKRDLPGALPIAELDAAFVRAGVERLETTASGGTGVWEVAKAIARRVSERARREHEA